MNPLVARIARALGRSDDDTRAPADLSPDEVVRAEDERRFDLDKAYMTRLEADREASPAFRQAMDDDPSFMYVDYPAPAGATREPSPTWDAYMASLDESAATGDMRATDRQETPRRDTGLER